jgi:WD40 repeat protein/serine/threonine protein kinase
MNADEATPLEEEFSSLLAACQEALAPGMVPLSLDEAVDSPELQARLERSLACLQRLQRLAPDRHSASALTGASESEWRAGYKLTSVHATGGIGRVWLAHDDNLGRDVALKELRPERSDNPALRERFLHEARITGQLEHPGIVPVYELVRSPAGQQPFYTMRLVKGRTLADTARDYHQKRAVGQVGPLEHMALLNAFVGVCHAIAYAHARGVIHRDLKGQNVVLGEYGEVIVLDWGFAKVLDQPEEGHDAVSFPIASETLPEQTLPGQVIGTPAYMAPEQAQGRRDLIDRRTDIYGLGAMLYEILTGQAPFIDPDSRELLRKVREEEPAPPRQVHPGASPALEAVCLRALAKKPADRYESASELARDVQRWLADEPVSAYRDSLAARLGRWARRHKPVVAGAAALLVTALVALFVGGVLIRQEQQRTDAARVKAAEEKAEMERKAKDELEGHLYAKHIGLAEREWAVNNFGWAEQLLEECPRHLRGWEWDYVMGLRRGNPSPFRGHIGDVESVAFHPDGRRLVSAGSGNDRKIRVWEVNTSKEIFTCDGGDSPYHAGAAFSPDGRYFAGLVGSKDVKVWDATTGVEVCVFSAHTQRVKHLAFSPDSRYIASCSFDQTIKIWEVGTCRVIRVLRGHTSRLLRVGFSPDGNVLCSADGNVVRLWDTATGEVIRTLEGHTGEVKLAVFSRDGTRIASASGAEKVYRGVGGEVKVWDATTGREVYTLRGHNGLVEALAFSADGRRLASAGYDQTVKIWDLAIGQEALTLRGHSDRIHCLAFSADGRRLASASADKTVRLWDATPLAEKPAQELRTLTHQRGRITSVAYSPDVRSLAFTSLDRTVHVWDLASGQVIRTLEGHTDSVNRVAFSIDGKLLASASLDKTVKIWDAQTGQEFYTFDGHKSVVQDVVFGPDERLASVCWDLTLKVWDARTGKVFFTLEKVHDDMVHSLTFSPDGRFLATAGHDRTVKIWDARAGTHIHTFKGHSGRVTSVAFSPDGQFLASAGMEGIVRIVETLTWTEVRTLRGHTGWVWCARFSPDGRCLASVGNDAIVRLWDVQTGQEIRAFHGHTHWVECVAFRPDGKQIASASWDETVKIWDATNGAENETWGGGGGREGLTR